MERALRRRTPSIEAINAIMQDGFNRKIEYVRVSLTDRCNLRCRYCMPVEGIRKGRHEDMLTLEEVERVIRCLAGLGIRKVRLTGGEPLVRLGITGLIRNIKRLPGIETVAITTNGILLAQMADELMEAGLDAANVSLDTLRPEAFDEITRSVTVGANGNSGRLDMVLQGVDRLLSLGCRDVKLNCVPIIDVNDVDIPALVALAKDKPIKVRFIELMPVGCAYESGYRGLRMAQVMDIIEEHFGRFIPTDTECNDNLVYAGTVEVAAGTVKAGNAKPQNVDHGVKAKGNVFGPAVYYQLAGFQGQVGFIDAIDHKFCSSCNRVRLTSDGFLKLCLNSKDGVDLRTPIRNGASDSELQDILRNAIGAKPKEHLFNDKNNANRDSRNMYQVGG